jgi:hypothetical protein
MLPLLQKTIRLQESQSRIRPNPRLRIGERIADVGPRRGVRAEVGQFLHRQGEVAPGGDVGETTANPGIGQDALLARWTAEICER